VAAQFLPVLVLSRRAGLIVSRHRALRLLTLTQSALALGSLALAVPLLAGWIPIWYLCALSFAVGGVQAVCRPGRTLRLTEGDLRLLSA
jgi:hypothetical protein